MTTIHKVSMPVNQLDDVIVFDMPSGAVPVSVGNQDENLCIWFVCNTAITLMKKRRFRVAGTGHPIDDVPFPTKQFLGSVPFADGKLIFHIFDL